MALPANFLALLGQPGAKVLHWIEIEGLPYAYSNRALVASFWTSLAAKERFEAGRPYLAVLPGGVDARLNPLNGIASPGEFHFEVVDADGFLTQAANVGRDENDANVIWLTADAAAGATTLNVAGNLSAWPASGVGYVGRTTFSYTGKGASSLTGVTLGIYRSQDVAISKGSVLTTYPQHLGLRRCWFYLAMSATETFAIGDRVARYAGLIEDYNLSDGLTRWVLTVRTPEKELGESTTLFRGFRSGRLRSSLPRAPGAGSGGGEVTTQTPEYERTSEADPGVLRDSVSEIVLEVERADAQVDTPWVASEWLYLRVEDEILLAQWDATNKRLARIHRGLYGTRVVEHSAPDAEWREGTFIVDQDATGIPEVRHSKFTQGDSPEAIILQLLLPSGTYGVLSEIWNAGFEPARVNVASFETLRDTVHAAEHLIAWVDEPVSFRELVVEHLLKPFGLFLVHGPDDTIEARYLRQGPPTTVVATVDSSNIVSQPQWKSGSPETVGEYRLEADLEPLEGLGGKPGTINVDVFVDTQRLYGKRAQQIVHRSVFLHQSAGSIVPAGSYRLAQRVFDSRRAYFAARYGRPPPVVALKVRWSLFHLVPGDPVTVVIPQIPSMSGSGRGYSGPAEVRARKPVDARAELEMDFLLLGVALDRYATVSPAAQIKTAVGGGVYEIELVQFSAADIASLAVGDVVVIVSRKFDTVSAIATITTVTATTVTLSPALAGTAGQYLVFADYDSQAAAQKASTAADLADANEQLGAANDAADRYTGI
jgi:hypothetical protein